MKRYINTKYLNEIAKNIHEFKKKNCNFDEKQDFESILESCIKELRKAIKLYKDNEPPVALSFVNKEMRFEGYDDKLANCLISILDYLGSKRCTIDLEFLMQLKLKQIWEGLPRKIDKTIIG